MENNNLIEVKNLIKTYNSEYALNDVSLNIKEGEFVVILGSSGSGKSTLLNMIGGMDKPDSGEVLFEGKNITKASQSYLTDYRRKDIGFIFQAFNLINDITVYENVMLQASLLKEHKDPLEVLEMVGLENKKDAYPKELSGGQQQRVSIARALVKDAKVILCDEPTGALDYETGKKVLALIESLVRTYQKTVIFVTHTKEIAKMADHVICMRSGKIIDEYYNNEIVSSDEIDW